jgi:hypothetical protein
MSPPAAPATRQAFLPTGHEVLALLPGRMKPGQDHSWDPETPRPPYRYGNTSVSPGSTKYGGFCCPKRHALNIVSLALRRGGSRVSGFEALNRQCRPQNEY